MFVLNVLFGQKQGIDQPIIDKYELSNKLVDGFQNDSAIVILTGLIDELKSKQILETPFGLKVQLNMAEALEQDDRDEIAISSLHEIADKGEKMNQWAVYVDSQLSLARIHEKRNRPESCLEDLNRAESAINNYSLDSLYPRLAIRKSSYNRIYADKDSAIYYAQEVLRTAPKFEQFEFNAVGNMLMGMLEFNRSFDKSKKHFEDAAAFWKGNGDYSGYGAMISGLTNLHLKHKNFKKAKYYNNLYLESIELGKSIGVKPGYRYGYAYLTKSRIFEAQGILDSALFYKEKGFSLQIADINKNNDAKVFEIESKYLDEKKAEQLRKQKQELKTIKQRRNFILALLLLSILSGSLLTYYYLKLRRSNELTVIQAEELKSANKNLNHALDQQITLRGELHHRVKNNIQLMLSLLELQVEEVEDLKAKESMQSLSERLYSMSSIHELLNQSEADESLKLKEYTSNLCQHFGTLIGNEYSFEFVLDIKDQSYNLATLSPLGIMLSELLMNSLKHANPKSKELKVKISHSKEGNIHKIIYSDNGVGFDSSSNKDNEGIGMYLLNSMSRQLEGRVETKNNNGAEISIFFKEKN